MSETNECLVCKAPIEYIESEEMMECSICHKTEGSKCRCINGHFVCNECHSRGMDQMFGACMEHASKNPFVILDHLMSLDFCHMNGPEHHVLIDAALLTAFRNAGGDIELDKALKEAYIRGSKVPGGVCGFWGACGAAISSGQFVSIVTKSNPLENEPWALSNKMTALSLASIAEVGGPRCCKRNARLAITEAVKFAKENFGIAMETPDSIVCDRVSENKQCIGTRCPYFPVR